MRYKEEPLLRPICVQGQKADDDGLIGRVFFSKSKNVQRRHGNGGPSDNRLSSSLARFDVRNFLLLFFLFPCFIKLRFVLGFRSFQSVIYGLPIEFLWEFLN